MESLSPRLHVNPVSSSSPTTSAFPTLTPPPPLSPSSRAASASTSDNFPRFGVPSSSVSRADSISTVEIPDTAKRFPLSPKLNNKHITAAVHRDNRATKVKRNSKHHVESNNTVLNAADESYPEKKTAPASPAASTSKTMGLYRAFRKKSTSSVTPIATSPPPRPSPLLRPFSEQTNPFLVSNYLSILFLHLVTPLLILGRKKILTVADLWEPVPNDKTHYVHRTFAAAWEKQVEYYHRLEAYRKAKAALHNKPYIPGSGPSVFHALRTAFGWRLYIMLFLECMYYVFYGTVPFSMRALVTYIYDPTDMCSHYGLPCGVWYSSGLGLAVLCSSICINHKFYHSYRVGSQMRSALMTVIYAKSLRLSNSARASSTVGQTLNLMSNDCARVFDAVTFFNTLFVAPTVIIISLGLLIYEIGIAAVAAIGLMLFIIPMQVWTARTTSRYRKAMLTFTDNRVKFISEILQGIRVIKLYNWEQPMADKIAEMRQAELAQLKPALLLKAFNLGILFVYPVCVTFVTFVLYAYLGGSVIPSNVFIVMSFLTLIRFPVSLMPQAITFVSEARVGLKRIQAFLLLEELQSLTMKKTVEETNAQTIRDGLQPIVPTHGYPIGTVVIKKGVFRWSANNPVPVLSNVNLRIHPGELVGVIGTVGSGKSSLLAAMLGEMDMNPDSVIRVEGKISFMHQKPWIRNLTVQQNILFGLPYEPVRYHSCVEAAALLPDFAMLPAGDQTEIGEQGVGLSGGQKARVSMARALYRSHMSDIYLCDDPFSAVDMHVGKHMFETAIKTHLADKTRIIVLNSHLHFLKQFHKILVITRQENGNVFSTTAANNQRASLADSQVVLGGTIAACGTYSEIAQQFPELVRANEEADDEDEEERENHVIFDPRLQQLQLRQQQEEQEQLQINQEIATALHHAVIRSESRSSLTMVPLPPIADRNDFNAHHPTVSISLAPNIPTLESTRRQSRYPSVGSGLQTQMEQPEGEEFQSPRGAETETQPTTYREETTSRQTHSEKVPSLSSEAGPGLIASLPTTATASVIATTTAGAGVGSVTAPAKAVGQLVSAESGSTGVIKLRTYLDYFNAASVRLGTLILGMIMFSYIAGQATRVLSDYWLVLWGTDNNSPPPAHDTRWWVTTWAGWISGALFFALSRAWVYTDVNIRSSRNLHNQMFSRLLHAPTNLYFDLTPNGRIMNKFSKDLEQIDTLLPGFFHEFVLYAFQLCGTITLACVVTTYFLPIIFPILIFFVWIQTFFRQTSRELKRLEGTTRSPIFSSFSETLVGLSTIRAYDLCDEFITENETLVDINSKVFLMGYLAERWLSIRLELCSFLVVFAVALLTSNLRETINPTLAGLTMIYALQMTGALQWVVRLSIQSENTMTAVERLTAFQTLPQEASYQSRPGVVDASWPACGSITFNHAQLRYRPELDLVMKGITCTIAAGEKIGIVGRTGSGKSTLLVALFRLVELSSGSIFIDGVDISKIGLSDLRSKLSIIPQDAVLFSGTVRYNLDPFAQQSDEAVWLALDRVNLSAAIRALPDGIYSLVSENGDNFSHGQKQLICIARALLRSSQILLLDEASASIDPASDRLLQETIAVNFKACTILTIAHRLNTVIEYDRVMVLRDGLIAEFDTPSRLLRNPKSLLYGMVAEGGKGMIDQFVTLTDAADERRRVERDQKKITESLHQLKSTLTPKALVTRSSTSIAPDNNYSSGQPIITRNIHNTFSNLSPFAQ